MGFIAAGSAGCSGLGTAEILRSGKFIAAVIDHVVSCDPRCDVGPQSGDFGRHDDCGKNQDCLQDV